MEAFAPVPDFPLSAPPPSLRDLLLCSLREESPKKLGHDVDLSLLASQVNGILKAPPQSLYPPNFTTSLKARVALLHSASSLATDLALSAVLALPLLSSSFECSKEWIRLCESLSLWDRGVAELELMAANEQSASLMRGEYKVDGGAASAQMALSELSLAMEVLLRVSYISSPPPRTAEIQRLAVALSSVASHLCVASTGKIRATGTASLTPLLGLYSGILSGLDSNTSCDHVSLLQPLLDLHLPSTNLLHRDQRSTLSSYHKPLTQTLSTLLLIKPDLASQTLQTLSTSPHYPPPTSANTDKEVHLLHTLDTLLPLSPPSALVALVPRLVVPLTSPNTRIRERALQFFKNPSFLSHLSCVMSLPIMSVLLRALAPVNPKPHWNPTVNKMTHASLVALRGVDESMFASACEDVHGTTQFPGDDGDGDDDDVASDEETKRRVRRIKLNSGGDDFAIDSFNPTSLKSSGWKAGSQPPSTVTGVAPWAVGKMGQPPVTVTGVAPWAMKSGGVSASGRTPGGFPMPKPRAMPIRGEVKTEMKVDEEKEDSKCSASGLDRVLEFMSLIKPAASTGVSSWSQSHQSPTPTLLPTLKFHSLVFGRTLGTGAFSTVKYARLITRGSTRSNWAEFAVKVIARSKITELGYEANVTREIAALRIVSHPNVARLVSSFRFRDGAYLVLEYAANGDLHGLVSENGSLDVASARFVTGEVLAALAAIHDEGFVFGDLKPENVYITETGHVKVGDFGGCRAYTDEAREILRGSTRAVRELRDGDWKVNEEEDEKWGGGDDMDVDEEKDVEVEDNRVEGTEAYMSPELVGGFPTPASDIWAFGCLVFYTITGRPPFIDVDRIVKFAADGSDNFFGESRATFTNECEDLVSKCCDVDPENRLTARAAGSHKFYDELDVWSLYQGVAPELGAGKIKKGDVDSQWTRRQHSSIWAPQPEKYDLSSTKKVECGLKDFTAFLSKPIEEVEEEAGIGGTTKVTKKPRLPPALMIIEEKN